MTMSMRSVLAILGLAVCLTSLAALSSLAEDKSARPDAAKPEKKPQGVPDDGWERIKLDGEFRSEGVAAADINHDGKIDVVAADVWYEAPDWKMHAFRPVGKFKAGVGYSQSFANFTYDINGDGWDDIIVIGFPGEACHWYENPQNKSDHPEGHWKQYLLWHSAANESPIFADVDGDGKPELVFGSEPEKQMGFLRVPAKDKCHLKWDFTPVSDPGDGHKNGSFRYYHGLGVADLNGDGRKDILIMHGWWEAPEDRNQRPWKWHPYTLSRDGKGNPLPAANMYTQDLDLDGDLDILCSCAHQYGVWWFENVGSKPETGDGNPQFVYHLIDESYSQTHAAEFVDLDGDGELEYVTGKRYFAHNGGDPGAYEPVWMYRYSIKREKGKAPVFTAHEIVAGRDTGVGTQFLVKDINGDKRPDIVLSNKKGVNVLVQKSTGAK